jgi:uncharacterized protein YuzE
MTCNYYAETDTLYIDFADQTSVESKEVSPDVVLDFDTNGNVVGIEIEQASTKIDLSNFSFATAPFQRSDQAAHTKR